jgi:hypothetical protein
MTDLLLTLLAAALVLAAIAPVLMAGGACIAAFMMQKDVLKHLALTIASLATLTLCALLIAKGMEGQAAMVKALVLAAPVWLVYLALRYFLFNKAS